MWYLVVKPGKHTHMTVPLVVRDPLQYRYCMLMGTGQASPRIVSQLYRALLKLQLLICISIKASWDDNKETSVPTEISNTAKACKEDHATCSSWTWVCFCHWNYTYMAFPACTSLRGTLGHPTMGCRPWGTTDIWILCPERGNVRIR